MARSPMERSAADEGARFEVRDGWNVAVAFGARPSTRPNAARTAGWADVSHLAKLELQGASEAHRRRGGHRAPVRHRGAPRRRLVVPADADPRAGDRRASAPSIRERLIAADGVNVVDVTTNFAALTIVGPLAREMFARFSAIDLRPQVTPRRRAAPGLGRRASRRSSSARPRIATCILFGWATGEYVWSVVADAGQHLGGRPIGVDALAG